MKVSGVLAWFIRFSAPLCPKLLFERFDGVRERLLRDFFEDKATMAELAQDVAGSISQRSQKVSVLD